MEQPKFWLQVRSEYIFENFEALTNYLRAFHYYDSTEAENFEFNSTLECMRSMSEGFADRSFATPFYKKVEFDRPLSEIVQVMCASILAAYKAGQTLHKVIIGLIDIILKSDARCPSDVTVRLVKVVMNCIKGSKLLSPGFSWKEVDNQINSFDLLASRLSQITFKEDSTIAPNDWLCIDNKGLITITPANQLYIAAMNTKQYNEALQHSQLSDFLTLPDLLKVQTHKNDFKRYSDFDRLFAATETLLRSLEHVRPAPIVKKKEYGPEDEFIVKVVHKIGYKIVAESVDSAYETIAGNVYVDVNDNRPSKNAVLNAITVGKYLLVKRLYNNNCTFGIKESLEMDYRHYASGFANQYVEGVFLKRYSSGIEFVTRDGFHVGVATEKLEELNADERLDLDFCCENGLPVPLLMYREAPDINGAHFNLYAEIDRDTLSAAADLNKHIIRFTADEAERNMFEDFMTYWKGEAESILRGQINFIAIDPKLFIPVLTALHRISRNGLPSCRQRLSFLTAMAMVCHIMSRKNELAYIHYQREFLRQEVNFAHGDAVHKIAETTDIQDVEEIHNCAEIINILSEYRKAVPIKEETKPTPRVVSVADEPLDINKTRELVKASNSLLHLLDNAQMDGIKQFICRSLEIEDEYESILDNRTFYGVESIGLEFKSSAVFPPTNQRRYSTAVADPELQKWAILKAVCGFLNSRSGGELLIGVKDTGYACGISDDMRELCRSGRITTPTSDAYRTYIQNIVDNSFVVKGKDILAKDVTRIYVDYELEENEEKATILRVRVRPYPTGLVQFLASEGERPEGVERSYVRQSGRTVHVTPEMANAILNYKSVSL